MNKRLMASVITAIVVILLVLLSPLVLGIVIEHEYKERIQTRQWLTGVEVQQLEYHRGWFHSTARLQLKVTNPSVLKINLWLGIPANVENTQFTIEQQIDHGPWLSLRTEDQHRFLVGAALITSRIHSAFGIINAISVIRFNGSLFHVINAPNAYYNSADGGTHYSVIGAQAALTKSANGHDLTGKIHMDQLDLQTSAFQQSVENFQTDYTLSNRGLHLFLGKRKTAIDAVTWETSDHQERIRLQSLFLQTQSQAVNNKVDYYLHGIIHSVITDTSANGPQEIQLTIRGLDLATITTFAQEIKQLQGSPSFRLEFTKYPQLVMDLLNKGFQLELQKLNINTSYGELAANGHIQLAPAAQPPHNFLELLNYLQVNLHIEISDSLLKNILQQIMVQKASHPSLSITYVAKILLNHLIGMDNSATPEAVIQQWLAKKWLIPVNKDKYQLDFEYKKQQAILNQTAVSPT